MVAVLMMWFLVGIGLIGLALAGVVLFMYAALYLEDDPYDEIDC